MRLSFKNVSKATVRIAFLLPVNVLSKAKVELHTARRAKLSEISSSYNENQSLNYFYLSLLSSRLQLC